MKPVRSSTMALAAVSLAALGVLTACGGSTDSADTSADGAADSAAAGEGGEAAGAMTDASFAVATYMDTIWPIEGNDYADAEAATAWCAQYATDPAGAVTTVVEYLSVEPDIASADPASVSTAIDEYLTNNCYLIEE